VPAVPVPAMIPCIGRTCIGLTSRYRIRGALQRAAGGYPNRVDAPPGADKYCCGGHSQERHHQRIFHEVLSLLTPQ
jgi:hypothetical protein